jgi:hypothetical protein
LLILVFVHSERVPCRGGLRTRLRSSCLSRFAYLCGLGRIVEGLYAIINLQANCKVDLTKHGGARIGKRCFANADIVKKLCGMYLFFFGTVVPLTRSIPKPYAWAKREWHRPAGVLLRQHRSPREVPTSKANEPFAMRHLMVVKCRNGSIASFWALQPDVRSSTR